jgi:hypothetical protein
MVAMMKMTKLNQMVGMLRMLVIEIFLSVVMRPPPDFLLGAAEKI